ncbi:serine protease trypsin-like protein [Phytophthora sojae]|uniref:Serine protease trypsin-like protein n=1 Tax=Phytophthora sojae (strain P6497) TaxID=1094619 RepID=G4YJG0_PHYSP|nr:serine protease trypsin-like protein [Phytophthora sojae]EGZ29915.1 serine protease trypsin-like protein [Phytophthora sojae]|eukprot:XP_009517190.1 serine protease trypsin-like protein [Phytophthora sojae]
MTFAAVVRAGVLASALAVTLTHGYAFSETSDASKVEDSTGLTVNEEDRIFGGSEADASKYPFVVSLRQNDAGGSTYCGGALIASQYVVTAAHCVKTDRATIYASIGTAFASGSSDGQQVKVIQGYRHPKYNKSAHLYDVGLLKLEKKVSTTTVGLAAPDGSDNTVGTVATVRGWGLTENGSQSVKMEEVNVNIISNAECNKEYGKRITEGMMCAGNGDGKDTCNGDSGGPLIANDVLVGIVSWGGKCGVNAGVYTRVAYVLDYINSIVSGGSGSSFTPSAPSSAGESRGADSSNVDVSATETPATETPTPVPITEAPKTEAPTPSPTPAPTSAPTTVPPDTVAPSTEEPETESPNTDQADQSESSPNSADHSENATDSAEQSMPTYDPTPASGKKIDSGKDCASQF